LVPHQAQARTIRVKNRHLLRFAQQDARLTAAGISLVDYGDLPVVRSRVDRATDHAQSIVEVQAVANRLADYVEKFVYAEDIPLVIGGDCTITLGVLAEFIRWRPNLGLRYLDGGMDVATPATYRLGFVSSVIENGTVILKCDGKTSIRVWEKVMKRSELNDLS
jgi:arginase family enzyme